MGVEPPDGALAKSMSCFQTVATWWMNGKGTWLILGCCGPHHDGSGHTNVWTSACEEANPCDHGKARSDHPSGKRRSGHRVSVAHHKNRKCGSRRAGRRAEQWPFRP